MTGNRKITIDAAVLRRCGSDLSRIADGLGDASQSIAGSSLSSNAFGLMNSWMVDPITAVSEKSTDLISVSGKTTAAVGTAATSSADDFEKVEQDIVTSVQHFMNWLDEV